MKTSQKKSRFGLYLFLAFCASWTASMLTVYLLVPALRAALTAPLFAVVASSFLLGFSVAIGFLILRPALRERAASAATKIDIADLRLFGPN